MLKETLLEWWNGARMGGRKEGQVEGRQQMLLHVLEERFGRLPQKVHRKVGALASAEELERLVKRALAANSLKELGLG